MEFYMLSRNVAALSLSLFITPAFSAEAIKPVFAWPSNLAASVSVNDDTETYVGDKALSESVKGTYRINTVSTDKGLNILYSDVDFNSENNSAPTPQGNLVQQLVDKISNVMPNYSVSKDGRFQRVTNLNEIHASISSYLDTFKGNIPAENVATFNQMTQGALSQEMLANSAAQSWHSVVEQWAGGEYSPDFSVESDFSLPHPLLGGFPIPMIASYSLKGRVPCTRDGVEKSCLRLVMLAKINKKKLNATMRQVAARSGQKAPFEITMIEIKNVVVTEPDTLVPHQFIASENTVTQLDNETVIKKEQKSRVTYKYGVN
jgi:hypothetical protein